MEEPKARPTRAQVALKLKHIPPDKFQRMTVRTIAGVLSMGALTVFLLAMSWLHFQRSGEPSLWLIGAGVFCGFVCGQIASGQIVGRVGVATLVEPLRALRDAWKGTGQ